MRHVPVNLIFEYAIRFPDGQYYLGPNMTKKGYVQAPENRGPVHHAYTYTERAAHLVVSNTHAGFEGCVVEKVL